MINNKIQSLYDLYAHQLSKHPNSKFLFDKVDSKWQGISFSEIDAKVQSLQNYFYEKKNKKR